MRCRVQYREPVSSAGWSAGQRRATTRATAAAAMGMLTAGMPMCAVSMTRPMLAVSYWLLERPRRTVPSGDGHQGRTRPHLMPPARQRRRLRRSRSACATSGAAESRGPRRMAHRQELRRQEIQEPPTDSPDHRTDSRTDRHGTRRRSWTAPSRSRQFAAGGAALVSSASGAALVSSASGAALVSSASG